MRPSFPLALALAWLAPALASAQLAGVPIDALTPEGMERVDVSVPEHEGHGVRLDFAPEGEGEPRATLRVDVLVAPSARAAIEAADWHERTITGELAAIPGLGDRARGGPSIVVLVRDNVFVVVRRIAPQVDCVPHAIAIDAALEAAPRGAPRSALRLAIPPLAEGLTPLQLPAGVAGAHVLATGSASARRTRAGWAVVRRGAGPWSVTVHACDALLRRVSAERSGE